VLEHSTNDEQLVVLEHSTNDEQLVVLEHSTNDEQLVELRCKCPLYMFIESKLVKHGIEVWVAGLAKNFYALHQASINLQD